MSLTEFNQNRLALVPLSIADSRMYQTELVGLFPRFYFSKISKILYVRYPVTDIWSVLCLFCLIQLRSLQQNKVRLFLQSTASYSTLALVGAASDVSLRAKYYS